ncbi:MAG: flagellar hook capping FlgD N-terminal domain-containing protein [Oscillospiraceae bacterium]|nr:flagellar hook capping FlgD N-terminal domain-containing protein [Oscillospiraceae bacterium]
MADTSKILSSSEQIQANYEKYKSRFKDSTEEMVSSETFLSLLVAEMTNQDPMEPTSNTEFVTQMAQFTSLQYSKDAATYAQSNYASSLVGKTVTAQKMDGSEVVTKTGVVDSVMKSGDSYTIKIDGVSFDISKVTSISDTKTDSTGTGSGSSSLGELIAKASMMIGMSATVNPSVEGGSLLDSGIISSIQVKDGQVRVIINDKGYLLEDIVEVAYPTIETDDTTENTEQTSDDSTADNAVQSDGTQLIDADDREELTVEEQSYAAFDIEDVEEVTGEIVPDSTVSEDIEDLEDLV